MEFNGALSPGSTIANSEMDDQITTHASSPVRPDPRTTLQHVLTIPESLTTLHATHEIVLDDDGMRTPGGETEYPKPSASTSRRRREGFGGIPRESIYAGNKIKHLKKDDGEPLWRKDIQYDFLKAVFDNDRKVFTNSYDPNMPPQNFADLYIDTMARSSKTSKILRDKLLTEHEPAKNMAMVCLLVNLGRMNTTLNCR